jgi:hypothetical protein
LLRRSTRDLLGHEFTDVNGLPGELEVGLFEQPRSYSAWIRFANATSASDRKKDVRGLSIKVRGVGGENLTPGSDVQDFVLNSHPVMMVPGPREFLELLRAVEAGGWRRARYFLTHPGAARIAFASRQHPSSHLDIPYWSTTPYLFGERRAVKYIVRPVSRAHPRRPALTDTYLHDELRLRLSMEDVVFDFFVQFQTDPRTMPIEDASVEWRQRGAYVRVAELRIPRQAIDVPGREQTCERTSFNPWNCLAEHRPPGPRNRRMIRRRLGQHQPEKLAERKGICGAPRDGALGVQAFEVADQQQAKVASGRQTRPADLVGVESLAERLDVVIEARVVEDMIQSRVERVRGRSAADPVSRPTSTSASAAVVVCPSPPATV